MERFLPTHEVSHSEADVRPVVERVAARHEGLGGLELAYVQRVLLALEGQQALALVECGTEEGIAVRGEDYLPGLEVEGDDAHLGHGYGESVDDGIGLVLLLHGLEHVGDDEGACLVVGEEMFGRQVAATDVGGALFSQQLLGGLGVVVVLVADEALAVAHHPHLAAQSAEDDARGGESLFGVLGEPFKVAFAVDLPHGEGCLAAELLAGEVFRRTTEVA